MKANTLRVVVLQAVIELLVVAEVETLLLKLPLQVPISLGNEEEAGMPFLDDGDHIKPVLRCQRRTCEVTPRADEDCIQEEHRHVAANAIALICNARDSFDHCLPKLWKKSIELQHIWPCWKVGASSP